MTAVGGLDSVTLFQSQIFRQAVRHEEDAASRRPKGIPEEGRREPLRLGVAAAAGGTGQTGEEFQEILDTTEQ